MREIRPVRTQHGEYTLLIPEMDETYHSRDGAIAESMHVFIQQGLERIPQDRSVRILEVGMGTGLNVLLTALHQRPGAIEYHTMEPFPLPVELVLDLGYAEAIGDSIARGLLSKIHSSDWNSAFELRSGMMLEKWNAKLQDLQLKHDFYDVVYFDAFAPKKQAELWEYAQLKRLYECMRSGGVLTTYSAAGQLKRDLRTLGFTLESPPGANGKREMTMAIKP